MSDLPSISCICLVYGRIALVEEAVESFLRQDYGGNRELILLNTCQRQRLVFEHPLVKVINHPTRPKSLGETRNIAVEAATGQLMVTWDSDDLMLPNHLSNFIRNGFDVGRHGWVRHSHQLYFEKRKIRSVTGGTCNTWAFTKEAWKAVGGYNAENCGEDASFMGKVTSKFPGVTVRLGQHEASYAVSWDDDSYHISGMGTDKPGQLSGTERVGHWTDEQLGALFERNGDVELKPNWKRDYVQMVATFTKGVVRLQSSRRGKVGFVNLGHVGDIINTLPMVKYIADVTGRKPLFFTSQTYGAVLEGVSYCEPTFLDIPDHKINEALAVAQQRCEIVLCTQMHGEGFNAPHEDVSYNTEAWRVCGLRDKFYELPLVFDQQGAESRKFRLFHNAFETEPEIDCAGHPPILLVNVTGGLSSPFSGGKELLEHIQGTWGKKFKVVDMTTIRAERIYDMLHLMEFAAVLISSDTYTLHLAAASHIPVVAIVNDKEMHGRDWLATRLRWDGDHFDVGYSFGIEHIKRFVNMCLELWTPGKTKQIPMAAASPVYNPKFFHAVEQHDDRGAAESQRKQVARQSWQTLYSRGVIPCHYVQYKRSSRDIGDDRMLPYLKDVLEHAMATAGDDDCIFLTNDDIVLHPELLDALRTQVGIWGACTAQRCEFRHETIPALSLAPEEFAAKGAAHIGRDLFAAKKSWLVRHWDSIPDFLLGAEMWDLCIAALVRKSVGHKLTRLNMQTVIPCAELPPGYVLHQWHNSLWAQLPVNTPSAVHNRRLFREWSAVNMPDLRFYENGLI